MNSTMIFYVTLITNLKDSFSIMINFPSKVFKVSWLKLNGVLSP